MPEKKGRKKKADEITTIEDVIADAEVLDLAQTVRDNAGKTKCLMVVSLGTDGEVFSGFAGPIGEYTASGIMLGAIVRMLVEKMFERDEER